MEDGIHDYNWLDCYTTEISDAKYRWENIAHLGNGLEHI